MAKRKKKLNKVRILKRVLLAILPGLIVAGLVFAANIYYNLDLGRIITENAQEFKDMVYLGAMEFTENAGKVSWINLPVGTVATGTIESYTAQIDSKNVLTVYGEADGSGGVKNLRVGIGTTTPNAKLDVRGVVRAGGGSHYVAVLNEGSQDWIFGSNAWGWNANAFSIGLNAADGHKVSITNTGNVGIGTTTPAYTLDVWGTLRGTGNVVFGSRQIGRAHV